MPYDNRPAVGPRVCTLAGPPASVTGSQFELILQLVNCALFRNLQHTF